MKKSENGREGEINTTGDAQVTHISIVEDGYLLYAQWLVSPYCIG